MRLSALLTSDSSAQGRQDASTAKVMAARILRHARVDRFYPRIEIQGYVAAEAVKVIKVSLDGDDADSRPASAIDP
jgi:hypothetical protein